ncbi:hypothetical protein CM49_01419 [Paenibacillus sp. P1XP2]|nr:hypothetical protein CM49_01419 [Paenibacillus sp. P1XP2]
MALLYRIGDVVEQKSEEHDMIYKVQVHKPDYDKWGHMVEPYLIRDETGKSRGEIR